MSHTLRDIPSTDPQAVLDPGAQALPEAMPLSLMTLKAPISEVLDT